MISVNEILMGRVKFEDLTSEIQSNIMRLHKAINIVRAAYGRPMKVNDGYRRQIDKPKNGAAQSKHFIGLAIDIDDNDAGDFWAWCKENLQIIKNAGLYMEDPRWTHGAVGTWMHFQVVPPTSGKFIFRPSMAPPSAPEFWDGVYPSHLDH